MRVLRSIAVALAVVVSASCAATSSGVVSGPPATTASGVRFELMRAEATSVALAGSFNNWSPSSLPLARSNTSKPGGLWTIVVPLPTGEHTFMFVVDGKEWVSPPMAEDYVDDGFGARNGIVVVRK
jgi:1,4-alpha-glucan branching enzyme